MIRLITRGDDAGSSRSANSAIRDAHEKGILRNTSVLATGLEIADAAEKLIPLAGLCIGLHATVTSEWDHPRWGPVLPRDRVADLLDDEGMLPRQVAPLHAKKVSPDVVIAEIAAQLAKLRELGFDVKYMDAHMGFTWLDGVNDRMVDLAKREGLVYQPKVDRLPKAEGEFDPHDHASRVVASLKAAQDGTYLLVSHPTYDDDEMRECRGARHEPGTVGKDRDGQRQVFMRDDILKCVEERGITPTRYDEI